MNRKTRITFWISTGLVAAGMVVPGAMNLLRAEQTLQNLRHLGYPEYFALILGVGKLLGAVALIAPLRRAPREWAYAGFVFMLLSAIVSHVAVGDSFGEIAPPASVLALLVVSYVTFRRLRPEPAASAA
jgi:hypothetical protein